MCLCVTILFRHFVIHFCGQILSSSNQMHGRVFISLSRPYLEFAPFLEVSHFTEC